MKRRFAGVRRKTEFSPNHVGNDLRILSLTADALAARGHEADLFNEGEEIPGARNYDLIFSMAQGPEGNRLLRQYEAEGVRVINSPGSVLNCYRAMMVTRLPENGIPFPRSMVIATGSRSASMSLALNSDKVWVKRGDVHAVHKEDVTLVYSESERRAVLEEFHQRGIGEAVLQEHLEGDTVKFYAVRDADFFSWYYLNGVLHTPIDELRLTELAFASAEILGLDIFGGDAIIGPSGSISIIDINDWPSFAPVREKASQCIAGLLIRKADGHDHHTR
ncbi:hypothetical protein EHM92_09170 [bacterium]|nr:MAG: hypothetical protein EHM92_09170 [bacterium]